MKLAQVKGLNEGRYVAREAMAKNLYWVYPVESPTLDRSDANGVKVKLPVELVRKIGAMKREGESLNSAVVRLLTEVISDKKMSSQRAEKSSHVKTSCSDL